MKEPHDILTQVMQTDFGVDPYSDAYEDGHDEQGTTEILLKKDLTKLSLVVALEKFLKAELGPEFLKTCKTFKDVCDALESWDENKTSVKPSRKTSQPLELPPSHQLSRRTQRKVIGKTR